MPRCLVAAAEHDYDEKGICRECGTSFLENGSWGKLNMRTCSNRDCRSIIAKLAKTCPKCEVEQNVTLNVQIYRYCTFMVLPVIRHMAKPREGNLSLFDGIFLFSGVVIGVLLGKAIRHQGQMQYQIFDIWLAIFISFVILPTIFREAVLQGETPLIVRFGLCIQQGTFSDLLVEGIEQGISNDTSP